MLRIMLLCAGLAGLGIAIAPADWPATMSAYSQHEMSPSLGYACWGLAIGLGLESILQFARFVRTRRLGWMLQILCFFFLAMAVAMDGTAPYCFCDDILNDPSLRMMTFDDDTSFGPSKPR